MILAFPVRGWKYRTNIVKVESRDQIYLGYAETKTYIYPYIRQKQELKTRYDISDDEEQDNNGKSHIDGPAFIQMPTQEISYMIMA